MRIAFKNTELYKFTKSEKNAIELINCIKNHDVKTSINAKNFYMWLHDYKTLFNSFNTLYSVFGEDKGKHHFIVKLSNI